MACAINVCPLAALLRSRRASRAGRSGGSFSAIGPACGPSRLPAGPSRALRRRPLFVPSLGRKCPWALWPCGFGLRSGAPWLRHLRARVLRWRLSLVVPAWPSLAREARLRGRPFGRPRRRRAPPFGRSRSRLRPGSPGGSVSRPLPPGPGPPGGFASLRRLGAFVGPGRWGVLGPAGPAFSPSRPPPGERPSKERFPDIR